MLTSSLSVNAMFSEPLTLVVGLAIIMNSAYNTPSGPKHFIIMVTVFVVVVVVYGLLLFWSWFL